MRLPHEPRCARTLRLALVAAAFLVVAAPVQAQSVRMLVQSSRLAGFVHDEAAAVFAELRIGDGLDLAREPDNPFDANAVRVEWRGHKLGYVPRKQNAALAWAMDRGETPSARVTRLRHHPNPRLRIEFDVYVQ
jgi:hypothetical protein